MASVVGGPSDLAGLPSATGTPSHNFHSLVDGIRWVENTTPDLGLWQDPSAMVQTQSRIDDAADQTYAFDD